MPKYNTSDPLVFVQTNQSKILKSLEQSVIQLTEMGSVYERDNLKPHSMLSLHFALRLQILVNDFRQFNEWLDQIRDLDEEKIYELLLNEFEGSDESVGE